METGDKTIGCIGRLNFVLVIAKLKLHSEYLCRLQVLQILKMITDREEKYYEYMETV